jgi:hypothetical protein
MGIVVIAEQLDFHPGSGTELFLRHIVKPDVFHLPKVDRSVISAACSGTLSATPIQLRLLVRDFCISTHSPTCNVGIKCTYEN